MVDPTPFTAWGPLGAVIFLVVMFIWYIDRRDKSWQAFTQTMRKEDNQTIQDLVNEVKRLASELVAMRQDFDAHDIWERERLRELQDETKPTPPRRRRNE